MRPLKVIAVVAAAAVALLAAAAGLLLWFFDPNDYKEFLTDWVEDRTGRTLIVRDDLKLEFFPWLAVEAGGITLGNAAGFDPSVPFATAERAAAQVALLPLLRRQVEIGMIQLDGLELNLARDADGRGNWEDFSTESSRGDAAADENTSATPAGGVNVEGVRVRDGVVYWREHADRLRYVASAITVETGAIGRGEPVDVDLAADVLDVESQRTFGVAARAEVRIAYSPFGESGGGAAAGAARDTGADARASAVELHDFTLELDMAEAGSAAFASGSFSSGRLRAGADGRIDIAAGNAASRLPAASAPTGTVDAGAAWSSIEFDPASGSLRVDSLATAVAGIEAQWQIEGRNVIDAPRFEGTVTVADASLDDAVATFGLALPPGLDGYALGRAVASVEFAVAFLTSDGLSDDSDDSAGNDGAFAAGPYRLASLTLNVPNAAALGIALSGEAQLADGILAARVDVPPFALGDALVALAREHAPAGLDFGALDRVALSSRIEGDLRTRRFALRDLDAAALGAQWTGSVDVIPEAGGSHYRGTLQTSRFEPQRLSQFVGELLAGGIGNEQLGTLALDTRFDYDTRRGRLALDALSLEAFGLNAAGRATVAGIGESPVVSGEARLATFSPHDLLARFGQPVPNTSDPNVMQRANLDARFEVGAERGRFTNIDLALDDSRISGDFTVENFTAPTYAFALAIDAVDADRYLPPRAADTPEDAPDNVRTAGDLELPAEALSKLRLDGRVSVGRLKLANLEFQEVATGITVGNGEGRLDSASAKLYGGDFAGGFHVRAVGGDRSLSLIGRATGLALEPMIVALTGDANFSGTGDFDLRLSGRGATVIDNVRSAGGDVSFSLRSGTISGFNLGRTLCSLYNATQRLPSPAEQPAVTAYEVIGGTAAVSDGVASSMDLLARTSFMDIAGVGSLGLAEQRLDYDLDATLTGSIDIAGCESMEPLIGGSIPFTLRGTVTDPDIRPDFSKLIGERIREELQDRVRDRVQDRLRELLR